MGCKARAQALGECPAQVECRDIVFAAERSDLQFTAFDASYLERLHSADPETERHFVDYFGALIGIKLRKRRVPWQTIEDLRQEIFRRVLDLVHAGKVRYPERLGALVCAVCDNVLKEHYRSGSHLEASYGGEDEIVLVAADSDVLDSVEVDEINRVVWGILEDLSERDRHLLQWVVLEERDRKEVCSKLGVTPDHLRVLVHRAKQSFKRFYSKRFDERFGKLLGRRP
jgi:RNA polymerase sigma-70 factor, ECF subfamily